MRVVRKIAVFLLGSVIFVSGLLKLMDPVGTSLLVGEYLKFLHLDFLSPLTPYLGVGMPLFETLLAVCLLTDVWKKVVAWVTLALMSFFTLLTLALWIVNPAMDCGCFGEAFHLTHLQSFVKNIVLDLLWVIAFVPVSKVESTVKFKYVSFSISVLSVLIFALYSKLTLPMVDFTTYNPGMEISQSEVSDLDETMVMHIYRKDDGGEGAFTPDRVPSDSSWTFVREEVYTKNLPESRDSEHPLSFYDASGEYRDALACKEKTIIVSVYDPESLGDKALYRISSFVSRAEEKGFNPIILLATTPSEIDDFNLGQDLLPLCYFADRRTLMTLNRSNGGATYSDGGLIVKKWSSYSLPKEDDLEKYFKSDSTEMMLIQNSKGQMRFQGFLLYIFAVMLIL